MTPIDDELRNLLHARADVLTPSADPLGGVERRARRMRRNRVAASVAGAALAVSAVAVAIPLLQSGTDDGATQFCIFDTSERLHQSQAIRRGEKICHVGERGSSAVPLAA